MEELNKLKELVGQLEIKTDEEGQIEILRKIGKVLLTEFVIQVSDVTIKPLWIEAYYYNESNNFKDYFVHKNEKQKEFGILYFHHKTDDQRNGVDICLSCGDYYLSYLLKYTLINGEVKTQSELSPLIRKKYKIGDPTDFISYTERIGLSAKNEKNGIRKKAKEKAKTFKLSIVRDFDKTFSTTFKFPKKESLVKEYLYTSKLDNKRKSNICKELLNYCLSDFKD